jgi:archaellum component FlaG (FlaF/FlaG flagellin family)
MDKRTWKVLVAFMLLTTICVGLSSATKNGEIVSVHVEPEFSVSGQYSTHTIIVKNTGTEYICFQLESWSWETEFWLDVGDTKTISWKRSMGEPGEITYPYELYWDAQWPTSNVLLDTLNVKRRCFSVEEVSDNDHDNLMYYVEVEELGTDPNDPDTDGDGKRDDVDERPATPEGSISITSEPSGASVYLDGTHMGKTPISLDDVVSGSHTIKLTKPGYNSKTLTLSLSSGGVENIRELLEPLTGSISVSSDPCGANIYLDGAYKGTTPKTISGVLIGSHTIRLEKNDYKDYLLESTSVEAETTTPITVQLIPSDTSPPTMRIDTPILIEHNNNGILEEGESLEITYGATDDSGVTSIKILLDGTTLESQNRAGTYTAMSNPLSVGTHTIRVEATDSRSNAGFVEIQILVERAGPSIGFVSTRTTIKKGEDAIFTLSAVNPIGNPPMTVQLILKPPSGVSVTSSSFAKAGSGIYTCTQVIESGDNVRSIEVRLTGNQIGTHEIESEVYYQFEGSPKSPTRYETLTLIVEPEPPASTSKSGESEKRLSGFGVVVAGMVLLAIYLRRKRA